MKILAIIAGTALSTTLLSVTPSQAQFFDPLFSAPAAAAAVAGGIVGGTVGTATGVATGGYYGNQYSNGYAYNNGYAAGYPSSYGAGYGGPAYDTGFWFDTPAYVPAPSYADSTTTYYDSGSQPIRTSRSAAARRNFKSSRDNQYQ